MAGLVDFARQVERQLRDTRRPQTWEPEAAARYMAEIGERRQRFEDESERLVKQIIQPRLVTLASYFENASLVANEPPTQCSCWFGYSERFPASTNVRLSVEHDLRYEKMAVRYESRMIPLFVKFDECDKLTRPLGQLEDDRAAEWVEERLLEFLDSYLQIDRGSEEFEEEQVSDPVCGMRITRSTAAASDSYRGHPYFFCSKGCQEKFAGQPTAYVEVKTL